MYQICYTLPLFEENKEVISKSKIMEWKGEWKITGKGTRVSKTRN
jgi:hypothetical protein